MWAKTIMHLTCILTHVTQEASIREWQIFFRTIRCQELHQVTLYVPTTLCWLLAWCILKSSKGLKREPTINHFFYIKGIKPGSRGWLIYEGKLEPCFPSGTSEGGEQRGTGREHSRTTARDHRFGNYKHRNKSWVSCQLSGDSMI
jgi:hypothetical protein